MFKFLSPAPHIEPLPADQVDATYKRLRIQVFMGIFLGYAAYYLTRKVFAIAMPYLSEQGFSMTELGFALSAISVSYGISKFVSAWISDRSNARIFLPLGLTLSAIICILMGIFPVFTSTVTIMFVMLFLNGWFQGMGWPPSGRILVHWFSVSERGTATSIWNCAHNVGGGLMAPLAVAGAGMFAAIGFGVGDYGGVFILPALVAILVAVVAYLLMRDTPQSCGLPPIEVWRDDYPTIEKKTFERELTVKEILFKYVLNNKWVWIIAFANIFVYVVRYGVSDWAPTFLSQEKGFDMTQSGWAYFLYEWAGIPGTLLCGWVSDKVFRGRRGPAGVVFMIGVTIAILVYWFNPPGNPTIDMICLIAIGFLIYGPVMLIGLQALDSVPKKAAGTAAGLTGLFGYLGGSVAASALMGILIDNYGWNAGFTMMVAGCIISTILFALTWNVRGQEVVK